MADNGLQLSQIWEPYTRNGKVYVRSRHNLTSSPRVEFVRRCMHDRLAGRRFRTGNAADDERMVRDAFRTAAHECARQDEAKNGPALKRRTYRQPPAEPRPYFTSADSLQPGQRIYIGPNVVTVGRVERYGGGPRSVNVCLTTGTCQAFDPDARVEVLS